jgi:hypothetical protein
MREEMEYPSLQELVTQARTQAAQCTCPGCTRARLEEHRRDGHLIREMPEGVAWNTSHIELTAASSQFLDMPEGARLMRHPRIQGAYIAWHPDHETILIKADGSTSELKPVPEGTWATRKN